MKLVISSRSADYRFPQRASRYRRSLPLTRELPHFVIVWCSRSFFKLMEELLCEDRRLTNKQQCGQREFAKITGQ